LVLNSIIVIINEIPLPPLQQISSLMIILSMLEIIIGSSPEPELD